MSRITTGRAIEGSTTNLLARVRKGDGTLVVQADVTSIAYEVYDVTDKTTATSSGSVVVATGIFDTLQTSADWKIDDTGYNFRHALPGSDIPDGDVTYRIQHTLTMSAGGTIELEPFVVYAADIWGS